jgi:hypothetical protein
MGQKVSRDFTESNIAVVSADKLNVVYRGVSNPISIAVTNCKSFTATGLGLNKISEGKYSLAPGQGLFSIIKVDIELNDGSKITEEHKFRIKGIKTCLAKINDKINCERCILEMTKEELFNSTIRFGLPEDFLLDSDFSQTKINRFTVKFSNKKIVLEGDKFNTDINYIIKKLKKGSIFLIYDIGYSFPGSENYLLPRLLPIKIMVVEEEVKENYFESKEFIRDSICRIKIEKDF